MMRSHGGEHKENLSHLPEEDTPVSQHLVLNVIILEIYALLQWGLGAGMRLHQYGLRKQYSEADTK